MPGPAPSALPSQAPPADPGLLGVLEAARRFLAYRDRVTAAFTSEPPQTLGAAIDRDFLVYDFEQAAEALRRAVSAAGTGQAAAR